MKSNANQQARIRRIIVESLTIRESCKKMLMKSGNKVIPQKEEEMTENGRIGAIQKIVMIEDIKSGFLFPTSK